MMRRPLGQYIDSKFPTRQRETTSKLPTMLRFLELSAPGEACDETPLKKPVNFNMTQPSHMKYVKKLSKTSFLEELRTLVRTEAGSDG